MNVTINSFPKSLWLSIRIKAIMILYRLKNSRGEIFVTISIDLLNGWVKDVWSGAFETQENFRIALTTIVELIKEYKLHKWLADLRKMEGSWDFNRQWMVEDLMPNAIKAGLKYEAIVIPTEVFSKLSTKETIEKLDNYIIAQFDDFDAAEHWLKSY